MICMPAVYLILSIAAVHFYTQPDVRSFVPVSYTHLDVYKRQEPENVVGTCGCGHQGCLEQIASATGIVNLAKRQLTECDEASILRQYAPLTAKDVLDAAKACLLYTSRCV